MFSEEIIKTQSELNQLD